MDRPGFSDEQLELISSTLIKEGVTLGADVSTFVPPLVVDRLREKLGAAV